MMAERRRPERLATVTVEAARVAEKESNTSLNRQSYFSQLRQGMLHLRSWLRSDFIFWVYHVCEIIAVTTAPILVVCSVILVVVVTWLALFSREPWLYRLGSAAYWTYHLLDNSHSTGGRRIKFFKRLPFWGFFKRYFPSRMIKQNGSDTFPADATYMIGYHPHGLFSLGGLAAFGGRSSELDSIFPGLDLFGCTLQTNFSIPILREFMLAIGCVSVSEKSIKAVLSRGAGNAVIIVPGGMAEALNSFPGTHDLTLRKRSGFFRIALETGSHLVPVYTFGENELFSQLNYSPLKVLNAWFVRTAGFFLPVFKGRWGIPFNPVPNRIPLVTVVGKPIHVKKNPHPSKQDIEKLKSEYICNLCKIFDEFANVYATLRISDLTIVE